MGSNARRLFRSAILGAPGSGKGTISSKITSKYDVAHVSVGDIFRSHVQRNTELGKAVQKHVDRGSLVPDALVTKIALDVLGGIKDKNWLLDGFPRTLAQAETLFATHPLDLVISLKIPLEVIVERVKGRWVHPGSGRVYHTAYKPPKVEGVDDDTGEPLIQRADDAPEAVLKRFKDYEKFTAPLTEFYKKRDILKEFEGSTSDEIWKLVDATLSEYLKVDV